MHSHRKQRSEEQRDREPGDRRMRRTGETLPGSLRTFHVLPRYQQSRRANGHDADFGQLDQPNDAGLVAHVGKLAGEGGKQEEGRDENA